MALSAQTIQAAVDAAHAACASVSGGANASYIPYLAKVPSSLFGVCRGHRRRQDLQGRRRRLRLRHRIDLEGLHPRARALNSSGPRPSARRSASVRPACRSIRSWRSNCTTASRFPLWSTPARSRPRALCQATARDDLLGKDPRGAKRLRRPSDRAQQRSQHIRADDELPQPRDRLAALQRRHLLTAIRCGRSTSIRGSARRSSPRSILRPWGRRLRPEASIR